MFTLKARNANMTSCENNKTSIISCPLWDTLGLLMNVNYILWMKCPMRGSKNGRELLEVPFVNKVSGYGHNWHHNSRPTFLICCSSIVLHVKWFWKGPTHTWVKKHQHHKFLTRERELLYWNVPLNYPT